MKKLIMSCLCLPLFFGAMNVYAGGEIAILCPQIPQTFEVGDQFQAPPSNAQPYWLTSATDFNNGTILTVEKDSSGNTIVYNTGGVNIMSDGSLNITCSGNVKINNDPFPHDIQVFWTFYSFLPNIPTSCTWNQSYLGFMCDVN